MQLASLLTDATVLVLAPGAGHAPAASIRYRSSRQSAECAGQPAETSSGVRQR